MKPRILFCTILTEHTIYFFEKVAKKNIFQINAWENVEWVIAASENIFQLDAFKAFQILKESHSKVKLVKISSSDLEDKLGVFKNIPHLSSADLFFNISPGYHIEIGLEEFVVNEFQKNHTIILRGDANNPDYISRSSFSLFCCKKEDLLKCIEISDNCYEGYHEFDLCEKMRTELGLHEIVIAPNEFRKSEEDILENQDTSALMGIYIKPLTLVASEILILFKNSTFLKGRLLYNPKVLLPIVLEKSIWEDGSFMAKDEQIEISGISYSKQSNTLFNENSLFYKLENIKVIQQIMMFKDLITNYENYYRK